MQVDDDLTAYPIDIVATFAAQRPRHRRECARVSLLTVVLVSRDVAVLAKCTPHVAGGEEDRARAFRAAVEELLAGVMKMRADPRSRSEFAGAELRPGHAVDAAIPRAEIAVGEHAIGKLAAYFQQAWSIRRCRQRCARSDCPTTSQEYRGQALELGPERVLTGCCRVGLCGKSRGNAKFRRSSVLCHVQVPRQAIADRRIVPNFQMRQVTHKDGVIGRRSCG